MRPRQPLARATHQSPGPPCNFGTRVEPSFGVERAIFVQKCGGAVALPRPAAVVHLHQTQASELTGPTATAGAGQSYVRHVSTPFSFEHVFRAPSVTALAHAYFDLEHSLVQDRAAELTDRVVVEETDTETERKVTWRVTSTRQLPVIARPFVSGGKLTFLESMTWNKTTNAITMSVVPQILGGRMQITGSYDLALVGEGKVRRVYQGTISAAIPLVGGKIERGILEAFTANMPVMTDCTQRWLER